MSLKMTVSQEKNLQKFFETTVHLEDVPVWMHRLQLDPTKPSQRRLYSDIIWRVLEQMTVQSYSVCELFDLQDQKTEHLELLVEVGRKAVCEGKRSFASLPKLLGISIATSQGVWVMGEVLRKSLRWHLQNHENLLWFFDACKPFSSDEKGFLLIGEEETAPFLKAMAYCFVEEMPYQFLRNSSRFHFSDEGVRQEFFQDLFRAAFFLHPKITLYALYTPSLQEFIKEKKTVSTNMRFYTGCECFERELLLKGVLTATLRTGMKDEELLRVLSCEQGAQALFCLMKEDLIDQEGQEFQSKHFMSFLQNFKRRLEQSPRMGGLAQKIFSRVSLDIEKVEEKSFNLFEEQAQEASQAVFQALCLLPHEEKERRLDDDPYYGFVLLQTCLESELPQEDLCDLLYFYPNKLPEDSVFQTLFQFSKTTFGLEGFVEWGCMERVLGSFLVPPLQAYGKSLEPQTLFFFRMFAKEMIEWISFVFTQTPLDLKAIGKAVYFLSTLQNKEQRGIRNLLDILRLRALLCLDSQDFEQFLQMSKDPEVLQELAIRDWMEAFAFSCEVSSSVFWVRMQERLLQKWKQPEAFLKSLLRARKQESLQKFFQAFLGLGDAASSEAFRYRAGVNHAHLGHVPPQVLEKWKEGLELRVSKLSLLPKKLREDPLFQEEVVFLSDETEKMFSLPEALGLSFVKKELLHETLLGHCASGKIQLLGLQSKEEKLLLAAHLRLLLAKDEGRPLLFLDQLMHPYFLREGEGFRDKQVECRKLLLAAAYEKSLQMGVRLYANASEYAGALKLGLLKGGKATYDLQSLGGAAPEYLEIQATRFESCVEYEVPASMCVEVMRK